MYRITTEINDLIFDLNEIIGIDTIYATCNTSGTEIYFDILFKTGIIRIWFEKHERMSPKYNIKYIEALETRKRLIDKIKEQRKEIELI